MVANMKTKNQSPRVRPTLSSPHTLSLTSLTILRSVVVIICYLIYLYTDSIQHYIDVLWKWLLEQPWYQTVYFETYLVILVSFPIYIPVWLMDWFNIGECYRIEGKGGKFESENIQELIVHGIGYFLSFGILDTFHVKRFAGVAEEVILEKKTNWIQTTRALPVNPPKLHQIISHIIIALIVYDILFFIQHFALHKSATLYRVFHKRHHEHKTVNAKVTDRMHPLERIALILTANSGLKLTSAHPFTRTVFVFVIVFLLTDNHSGYDFPWNYDKIIPFNIVGGSRVHYEHHDKGMRYYQPLFTYADALLEWYTKKKKG